MKNFEKKLSKAIKDSHYSYQEIAEKAGINVSNVKNYANGTTRFKTLKNVKSICDVIGLDVSDLFGEKRRVAVDPRGRRDTIEDLTYHIEDWFYDRNLHTQEPSKQFLKVAEEVGELGGALARQDDKLIEDALGDVFVTLIGISMQTDIDFTGAVQTAYDEIKNRKGRLVGGVFVKDEE